MTTPPTATDRDQPVRCLACARDTVVRIVYGMPGPELADAAEAGTVTLGGCMVFEDAPVWHCRGCDHRWR